MPTAAVQALMGLKFIVKDAYPTGNPGLFSIAWSPTNVNKMAISERGNDYTDYFHVYILDLDTTIKTRLTTTTGEQEQYQKWSKDGNYIIYEDTNNHYIYRGNVNTAPAARETLKADDLSSLFGFYS